MKLNQLLPVEKAIKSETYKALTDLHKASQKTELYDGHSRTYQPMDEEGERFPDDTKLASLKSGEVLDELRKLRTEYFDIVLRKDLSNLDARADVVVDGELLVEQVPVTYLLFMEKELKDLETFLAKMPTLDPSEEWGFDETQDAYRSKSKETAKTKKVPKAHVVYEATEHHPAQVQTYTEDVVVGYWTVVKYSTALPAAKKREMLKKLRSLQHAVKVAREEANSIVAAEKVEVGKKVFDFLLS